MLYETLVRAAAYLLSNDAAYNRALYEFIRALMGAGYELIPKIEQDVLVTHQTWGDGIRDVAIPHN